MIELEEVRARLEEAEATLSAIRCGEVDALVVACEGGDRIYTLEGAETPYRVLIEAMSEGALTVDPSRTILYANRRFAEMVGQPLERVVGSCLQGLALEERELDALVDAATRAGADRREVALRTPGGPLPVLASASRLPGDQSGRVCIVITDLTSQKRSEALERLEREARTQREIAEARAEELARSNADLGDFAYVASHDLKEPLRGISTCATILIEDAGDRFDDAALHKLRTMVRLSKRMHDLLDSLLEYGRIGRINPQPWRVHMGELAAEVIDSLGAVSREESAQIHVQPGMPSVECDRVRVHQLLSNLVGNAIKYSPPPAQITIGHRPGPGGTPVFFVRDRGIGIDAAHHERIFGMFKRLHAPDKYGGGTGVGLAIVRKIAEQHGGRAWVESVPGEGSTFCFTLAPEPR